MSESDPTLSAPRRAAVVTGADEPTGSAVARTLADRNLDLALMGREMAELIRLADEIAGRREAAGVGPLRLLPRRCDLVDEADVTAAFAAAQAALGDLAILVNAAGRDEPTPLEVLSSARWDEILDVNLKGPWRCIREVLPAMKSRGQGRIVNVASSAGLRAWPRLAAAVASRHALVGLTRALALDLGPFGITVNAVCPGWMDHPSTQQVIDDMVRASGRRETEVFDSLVRPMGLGRLIEPREVAEVVAWLCSDAAASTTGQAIGLAGGEG